MLSALQKDQTVVCWGNINSPDSGDTFVWIDTRLQTTCGVTTEGSIQCWGTNGVVSEETSFEGSYLAVAVGQSHKCALTTDKTFECINRSIISILAVPFFVVL